MSRLARTRTELESMIVAAVRARPRCESFISTSIYSIFDSSAEDIFSWTPGVVNYGKADAKSCDAVLREVIPRLQWQYDLDARFRPAVSLSLRDSTSDLAQLLREQMQEFERRAGPDRQ